MQITRRIALLGASGGMIGGLPVAAHPLPILPASPFLMTLQAERATFRRVNGRTSNLSPWEIAQYYQNYQSNPPPPPIQTHAVVCDDGFGVKSVYAAEDRLLDLVSAISVALPLPAPSCCGDALTWPHIQLNRQCNLIAARTRVGPGNIVLMNSATFDRLERFNQAMLGDPFRRDADQTVVGRWTCIGVMNKVIPIYASDHMPPMDVVVMYRGGMGQVLIDHAAVLLDRSDGLTLVHDSVANYIRRMHFFDPTLSG